MSAARRGNIREMANDGRVMRGRVKTVAEREKKNIPSHHCSISSPPTSPPPTFAGVILDVGLARGHKAVVLDTTGSHSLLGVISQHVNNSEGRRCFLRCRAPRVLSWATLLTRAPCYGRSLYSSFSAPLLRWLMSGLAGCVLRDVRAARRRLLLAADLSTPPATSPRARAPYYSPRQVLGITVIATWLLIDAMFGNAADFVFEPNLANYARSQARRAEAY
jgi:hypothetical protein